MSDKLHIRFVINPKSGKNRKKRIPELINEKLNLSKFNYDIVYTEYKGHAVDLAKQAITEKVDVVCAIGGDGSVHEIGTALIGTEVTLAIIPKGSGNGLARHLKIPRNTVGAIGCINEFNVQKIDTVKINDTNYLGVAGVGIDALIADKFENVKKRGLTGYIKIVLKEYFKYKPIDVRFRLDDQIEQQESVFICSIANGSQFGNGFVISPKSIINDGKIELFRLRKISFFEIPIVAFRFFNGTIHKSRFVNLDSFVNGEVQIDQDIIHLDGEPVRMTSPLTLQVNPKSLNVISKKK